MNREKRVKFSRFRNRLFDLLGEIASVTYIGQFYTHVMEISPQTDFATCNGCGSDIKYFERKCECGNEPDWDGLVSCRSCDTEFSEPIEELSESNNTVIEQKCCRCGDNIWLGISDNVIDMEPHTNMVVSKSELPKPSDFTHFRKAKGDPTGQQMDYRAKLSNDDERGIHVKEFDEKYHIHWDECDPSENRLRHFIEDANYWWITIIFTCYSLYILYKIYTGDWGAVEARLRGLGPILPGGSGWERQFNESEDES